MTLRKENIQTRNRKLNTKRKNFEIEKLNVSPVSSVHQNYENNILYFNNNPNPQFNDQFDMPQQQSFHSYQNYFVHQSQLQDQIYSSNSFGNFYSIE